MLLLCPRRGELGGGGGGREAVQEDEKNTKEKSKKNPGSSQNANSDLTCPKCEKGKILKGKTAFGCSEFKSGCNFKVTFEQYGKKLTNKQVETLIGKGKTGKISGFKINGEKEKGILSFNDDFSIGFHAFQE